MGQDTSWLGAGKARAPEGYSRMRSNQVKVVKRDDSLINLFIHSTIIYQILTIYPFILPGARASKKGQKSVVSYSLPSRMGKQING